MRENGERWKKSKRGTPFAGPTRSTFFKLKAAGRSPMSATFSIDPQCACHRNLTPYKVDTPKKRVCLVLLEVTDVACDPKSGLELRH